MMPITDNMANIRPTKTITGNDLIIEGSANNYFVTKLSH